MSDVRVVRKSPRLIETSVCPDIARLVQPDPFGEENYLTVTFDSEDVASDRPLKLTALKYWVCLLEGQTYGFPTMITKLLLPPRRLAGARIQAVLLQPTPKGCTR